MSNTIPYEGALQHYPLHNTTIVHVFAFLKKKILHFAWIDNKPYWTDINTVKEGFIKEFHELKTALESTDDWLQRNTSGMDDAEEFTSIHMVNPIFNY